MEKKRICFTLEEDWYRKWQEIAKQEYRTLPKQTAIAVKNHIRQYEQEKQSAPPACQTEEDMVCCKK